MGEPEGAVAGAGEDGVALAVALEGAARAVKAPAVGFDDQTRAGEEEVDAQAGDPSSRRGALDPVLVADGEQELLELGVGEGELAVVGERLPERGRSALAGVGSCQPTRG